MTKVHVDYWTRSSVEFDYEDFLENFIDLYEEWHEDEWDEEQFIRHVLLQEGFDYVMECDFADGSRVEENGFEIEIDD